MLLARSNLELTQKPKRSKQEIAVDILESIDDYMYALDKNWNFLYINKTAAEDFGFPPEKISWQKYLENVSQACWNHS